ncbi:DUF4124 domain-containing protein [Aliikangiella sp. G2MR2-5]|uniref:DUF4124 domain-containing protein n=1 Tax=Aliikangiella sp. G2MR2-5 TaxID=2788943 RepID=UPI0018AAA5F0|nr:DUF4124 domain-containing protein [Aliikangiella sp. G2MR2-5]
MKLSALISFIGLFFLASVSQDLAAAKYMYKWKGADGQIHYSERPPQGVEYTRIKVADDGGKTTSKVPQAPAPKEEKKEEKKSNYAEWRDENCRIAKENLDILHNSGRISQDDGQGGTRLMTDEERKENIKSFTEKRDKYCSSEAEKK